VRDALHGVLNRLLNAKQEEVARYADGEPSELAEDEAELAEAWAAARHAVSNPVGLARVRHER
jgi:hypothetical protein